jgi:hypothetical protein
MERFALGPCQKIPTGHFQARAREGVSLDQPIKACELGNVRPGPAKYHRRQEVPKNVPARFRGFRAVKRVRWTCAFAPANRSTVVYGPNKDVIEMLLAARAGLKRMNERKANQQKVDPVDEHGPSGFVDQECVYIHWRTKKGEGLLDPSP